MDHQLANYFFEEASKAFAFMVDEHNFSSPRLEIDNKIDFAFVTFMGKKLAIECILDEREADIDCKIASVDDGKKSTNYALDDHGVRVREGLVDILRRKGIREHLFERAGGLELYERIRISLVDFAQMLKKYGQDILADSPTALT